MTAPPPGQLASAAEALALQVNRDTVLQARAALLSEALRLSDAIKWHGPGLSVGLCGGDPVSTDAAKAFGERIEFLVSHCQRYTKELESAVARLEEIARNYGYTEDEIAGSFNL